MLSCQHGLGYHGFVQQLGSDEMALWHAWKRAAESVRGRVAADVTAATGLSDPDFGVLTRVVEVGGGRMRQNELADSMGFHRSRLSHHLSRMRERGLITTEPSGNGVEVIATELGHDLVGQARPVHAAAVRRHLIGPLDGLDRENFRLALERLMG
jgi:DNA-binding MarR family transcriptional regulator